MEYNRVTLKRDRGFGIYERVNLKHAPYRSVQRNRAIIHGVGNTLDPCNEDHELEQVGFVVMRRTGKGGKDPRQDGLALG